MQMSEKLELHVKAAIAQALDSGDHMISFHVCDSWPFAEPIFADSGQQSSFFQRVSKSADICLALTGTIDG